MKTSCKMLIGPLCASKIKNGCHFFSTVVQNLTIIIFSLPTYVFKQSRCKYDHTGSVITYFLTNLPLLTQLEEKLKEKVDPELAEKIDLNGEQDVFHR